MTLWIPERIKSFVDNRVSLYDGSHDITHAARVALNAHHLLPKTTRHARVAIIAAYAHDACDKKYGSVDEMLSELFRACMEDGLSHSESCTVMFIVKFISFTRLLEYGSPKADLASSDLRLWSYVSDSDVLESMGATGVVRTLMYQGSKRADAETAINYMEDKLLKCVHFLNHPASIAEGCIRTKTMTMWIHAYRKGKTANVESVVMFLLRAGERHDAYDATLSKLRDEYGKDKFLKKFLSQEYRESTWHGLA